MGPLDAADPDCTFQQACIPSEKARIPWNLGNTLGMAPGASGILGWGGLVWGASRKEAAERNGRMTILWGSSLSPPDTPPRLCPACTCIDGQTDTHMRIHARFLAQQHEGAQEGQPAPCPAPLQLPSLALTFLSPPPFFLSAPSLALFVWVSLTLPVCYAGFLLTLSPCPPRLSVSFSLSIFLSHSSHLSYFLGLSIGLSSLCCSSAQPSSSPLPPQSPLSGPGGQSDCKEGWQGEMSDSESESLL